MYIYIHIYIYIYTRHVRLFAGPLSLKGALGLDIGPDIICSSRFVRVILAQGPC